MAADVWEIAGELEADLQTFAAAWHTGGDVALIAAIAAAPGFSHIVRKLPGAREYVAMRLAPPPDEIEIEYEPKSTGYDYRQVSTQPTPRRAFDITLGFLSHDTGERLVVVRAEPHLRLLAGADLGDIRVWPVDDALSEALAMRFGVGLDRRLDLPAALSPWSVEDEVGLLRAVDAAARLLAGTLRVAAATYAISRLRRAAAICEQDPDIAAIDVIDGCLFSAEQYEWNRGRAAGPWTVRDELQAAEDFYAARVGAHCRSLIERFRDVTPRTA